MTIRAMVVPPEFGTIGSAASLRYYTNWKIDIINDDDPQHVIGTGTAEIQVLIPYTLNLRPRKIDDYIRKTIADMIFNGITGTGGTQSSAGWVIDPDDIFFPMMN